ncbi:MAG: NAD(P)-binding domain-containing protein [Chloroflexota bacterium]|nr:NAD(P)-binding domain-containing protein [Chloroflexota bacterium]
MEHHSVIVVGGGPGGLGVAATLEGWHPRFEDDYEFPSPEVQQLARKHAHDPLALDLHELLERGHRPIEFFRMRHHPVQDALPLGEWTLKFAKHDRADWLMLTTDGPGGIWNNVPRQQLTLGPAHWMELAHYPIAKFYEQTGRDRDLNALVHRDDLVPYYRACAEELGLNEHIKTGVRVTGIRPPATQPTGGDSLPRFTLEAVDEVSGVSTTYSSDHLVFAVGPRSALRRLDVDGQDQDYVSLAYTHPDDYPGERVLVVGGGRSADWAAQELHDDGRTVVYAMRQKPEPHLKLIYNSQFLPYYARWAEILAGEQTRMGLLYASRVTGFGAGGLVSITTPEGPVQIEVDHAVVEIGGDPDYGLLSAFGDLTFHAKRDNFRFQLMQMVVDQATFESVDIPGLYPAGYTAQGTGLSVIGFHAGCFLIAGDILRKLGRQLGLG